MPPDAAQKPGPPSRRTDATPAWSLERKLPVLMAAPLFAFVALSLIVTYGELVRSAEMRSMARLLRAAREVAATAEHTMLLRADTLRQLAADPALVAALRIDDPALRETALVEALEHVRPPADSAYSLVVLDMGGRPIVGIGPPTDETERARIAFDAGMREAPRSAPAGTTHVAVGPLHADGDQVRFWVSAPIVERDRVLGLLAQRRRVGGSAAASQTIGALIGEDVVLSLRNTDDDFWSRSPGGRAIAPAQRENRSTGLVLIREDEPPALAAEAGIAGSPWVVVLETPLQRVHARPRAMVVTLSLVSLLLVGGGVAYSWIISRRITGPLASLTTAAESLARGEYGRPVPVTTKDEIGRLSMAFNAMAAEVDASRRELERQVEQIRSAAEERERANVELQRAIRAAEQAREESERASRAKSDFLAVMSHELRTPLNAIGGYAQLLEMGIHGPVTDAQREALARLGRSQSHLLSLINDVLNFAKIDSGQLEYAIGEVVLDDTLGTLETLVAPQVRAKGLTFDCRPCGRNVRARADREKLQQIALNLIVNAIKFTPPGGTITVDCECDDERALVHVRDTGIGVAPRQLATIFEPFVQVDRALNRPHDGVGLGLAISRDLARGMGGDLSVRSEPGAGSVFTLSLSTSPGMSGAAELGRAASREADPV
ncbi:MAG TPA: ATP-binding protein [Gemmatimonadaceae bacterium]|nr:ATP-binding protein [Gemmatimonadaceae bacterium]